MQQARYKPILILCIVGGIVISVFLSYQYFYIKSLNKYRASATATVIGKNITNDKTGPGYFITYTFKASNGQDYTNYSSNAAIGKYLSGVTPEFYQSTQVGQPIDIVYNTKNPKSSYIAAFKPTTGILGYQIIATISIEAFFIFVFIYFFVHKSPQEGF